MMKEAIFVSTIRRPWSFFLLLVLNFENKERQKKGYEHKHIQLKTEDIRKCHNPFEEQKPIYFKIHFLDIKNIGTAVV